MLRSWLFCLVVAFAAALSIGAQAETLRVPAQGEPALAVDLPAGWSKEVDQYGNVDITHPSRHVQIRISVIEDPSVAATALSEMATNMLTRAGFPPYSRTEPTTIAGRSGQAFLGTATNSNGANLSYRIVWVKLDASHAAVVARLAAVGATAEETGTLDALVGKVRIIGAR